ncbi:MAG: nucleotide exchange factor GrpE [Clostridiales Family XIII bacterium]|jgi:molecular chaperone GrpE|nr:nucleotide exchange factor GrpE [Clostridiales Family XIII bacterium]
MNTDDRDGIKEEEAVDAANAGADRKDGCEPDDTVTQEREPAAADEKNTAAEEKNTAAEEELNTRYMRLAADFQNYKRRVEKEKSEIYAYANEKIMTSLLDVADNFERAIDTGAKAADESFAKGMELIFKQLADLLVKNGLEEINCLGEEFDPAVHHAVMMEDTGEYESGKVSDVLKKGYRLKDRVIRPAMVKVAQ